jgi:serine phosphatase RsbU (regulator of sigma subunit)
VAGATEATVINVVRPSEWELAWISDVLLSTALGVAVYLWRHLQASRQALAARERAELVLQTQLTIAADIQRRLLPELPAREGNVEWAASLRPAAMIGGDFYDLIELTPGRWLVLVADVAGKGIPAAMVLGSLRAAFRALARQHDAPAQVLTLLSEALFEEWEGKPYVTAIVARFDAADGSLHFANAGHPSAIVMGPAGVRLLDSLGPPAGLLAEFAYDQRTIRLRPGDTCVLMTDGVTEALEDEGTSPVDRIIAVAQQHADSAQSVRDAVMTLALQGKGPREAAEWKDDRTVVVLAIREPARTTPRVEQHVAKSLTAATWH